MIVINFAHPMTEAQRVQLESMTSSVVDEIRDVPCQFDNEQSFAAQVAERVDAADLSSTQWQTEKILINPPAYAPAASTLIAELHGRMGYFPALIRIRPLPETTPQQFEVAEIINLQEVRDEARRRRQRVH